MDQHIHIHPDAHTDTDTHTHTTNTHTHTQQTAKPEQDTPASMTALSELLSLINTKWIRHSNHFVLHYSVIDVDFMLAVHV